MRVIFSRKGFDSAAGGCASPLIDGCPLSLPIPSSRPTPTTYGSLQGPMGQIVSDLTRGRLTERSHCHFDPDIEADRMLRDSGWRGALGQVAAAQGHLSRQGVTRGDLFLFWGLFRPAEFRGRWQFCGERENRIFGWLQIDAVEPTGVDPRSTLRHYPWLREHPHVHGDWSAENTIYVASPALSFRSDRPGWGVFKRGLRLTAAASRLPSEWQVPSWLNPRIGGTGMTYHPLERWSESGLCRVAARGQEFVADIGERADAMEWLDRMFDEAV